MPQDLILIPVHRTIGKDSLVDEFVLSFTHDIEMDWMLPGVAPTGKPCRVPMLASVQFEGDRVSLS